jgi:hypothetical protein
VEALDEPIVLASSSSVNGCEGSDESTLQQASESVSQSVSQAKGALKADVILQ